MAASNGFLKKEGEYLIIKANCYGLMVSFLTLLLKSWQKRLFKKSVINQSVFSMPYPMAFILLIKNVTLNISIPLLYKNLVQLMDANVIPISTTEQKFVCGVKMKKCLLENPFDGSGIHSKMIDTMIYLTHLSRMWMGVFPSLRFSMTSPNAKKLSSL